MSKTVTIPRDKLQEGMNLCAKNIRAYLKEIQLILGDPHDYYSWHGVVLAIFGLEELSKYSELKRAKDSAKTNKVEIDSRLFGGRESHEYKQDLARKLVGEEDMKLISAKWFKPDLRITDVEISPELRLNCAFVNWKVKSGEWVVGTPLVPSKLSNLVRDIAKALESLENVLSSPPQLSSSQNEYNSR